MWSSVSPCCAAQMQRSPLGQREGFSTLHRTFQQRHMYSVCSHGLDLRQGRASLSQVPCNLTGRLSLACRCLPCQMEKYAVEQAQVEGEVGEASMQRIEIQLWFLVSGIDSLAFLA